jgi:hypothetical protein
VRLCAILASVDIGRDPPRLPPLVSPDAAVPGLCILRSVSVSGGRGMVDMTRKDSVKKTSYVEISFKTDAEFILKQKPSAGFYLFAHYVCYSARCRPHFNIYYFSDSNIQSCNGLRYQVTSAAGLTRGHLMTN